MSLKKLIGSGLILTSLVLLAAVPAMAQRGGRGAGGGWGGGNGNWGGGGGGGNFTAAPQHPAPPVGAQEFYGVNSGVEEGRGGNALAGLRNLPTWNVIYQFYGDVQPYTRQLRSLEH